MNMKRFAIISAFAVLALALATSCAKKNAVGINDANVRFWDAWILVQKQDHPEYLWTKTALGSYVLENKGGDGSAIGSETDCPYVLVNYETRDLDGNILDSNREQTAKQLGTYSQSYPYGPRILARGAGNTSPGVDEVLSMMSPGQRVNVVIPGWLASASSVRYETEKDYRDKVTGVTGFYDLELLSPVKDIDAYQVENILAAAKKLYGKDLAPSDSLVYGLYYIQTKAPDDTAAFDATDKVLINYTGKFLSGQAFDTTLKDTAKVHNIYNASTEYSTKTINWSNKFEELTMGESDSDAGSLITGFKYALFKMKKGEKGVALFISSLGYGASGSQGSIPGYTPLIFELETLDTKN